MLMVAVAAFITRVFVERKGFKDAGWNLGHYKWYVGALLFCMLLWLGPVLAALPFGKLEWQHDLSREESIEIILSLGGVSLLAGFGEEFGWRGYLLPRLLLDCKLTRPVLFVIGLIWGIWHCAVAVGPLVKAGLQGAAGWPMMIAPTVASCVQMVVACVALSSIFGAVWLKYKSIFLSSFLHGYWIGIRDSASHLFSYPTAFRLITIIVVLVAWLLADRWLQKYERSNAADIHPLSVSSSCS
jgi:membrane protease YdiL (CAAX protease family)